MARLAFLIVLGIFLSLVNGYLITKPGENEIWNFGHGRLICWTSVVTDPPEITIAIVNMNAGTYPTGFVRIIEHNVKKERGKFMINSRAFKGLNEGKGYQINILDKDARSILAQSPQFTLSAKHSSHPGPSHCKTYRRGRSLLQKDSKQN